MESSEGSLSTRVLLLALVLSNCVEMSLEMHLSRHFHVHDGNNNTPLPRSLIL